MQVEVRKSRRYRDIVDRDAPLIVLDDVDLTSLFDLQEIPSFQIQVRIPVKSEDAAYVMTLLEFIRQYYPRENCSPHTPDRRLLLLSRTATAVRQVTQLQLTVSLHLHELLVITQQKLQPHFNTFRISNDTYT